MAYRVEWTNRALKELKKLPGKQARIIASWVKTNLDGCENPRQLNNAAQLGGVRDGWRWRVGNYRVLGTVRDETVTVELFRIGHRREVYRSLPKKP